MRITRVARTALNMSWVTPTQFTKSNKAHIDVNRAAVSNFLKVNPPLGRDDRLLDFGCGTGETTVSMARGQLGGLGHPGQVLGVDVVSTMVDHCLQHHQVPGLKFDWFDVEDANLRGKFTNQFTMVTSFNCLHWVSNQPAAIQFFNKSLVENGKFLFVICSTQSACNVLKREFEHMKEEDLWADLLAPCSWPHSGTVHTNSSWMSTVDKRGMGPIMHDDFVNLMQNHGFQVDDCITLDLEFMVTNDFVKNFFKSEILTGFPELTGEARKEFFDEFISRAKKFGQEPDEDGLAITRCEGFHIFGKKIQNI